MVRTLEDWWPGSFYGGSANGAVRGHPAANGTASKAALEIGEQDNGGVYVGLSASDGKPLHAALTDEPSYLTFEQALEAAAEMRKQPGRENAHVPTPEELAKNLFGNRNAGHLKGTFNTSGSSPAGCYRSSEPYCFIFARVRWFDDGHRGCSLRNLPLAVRLVW